MSEQESTRIVREVFAAFGRGDGAAFLELLAADVVWHLQGVEGVVPYAGEWRGRDGVAQFLAAIGSSVEMESFEPREFVAQGERIVVLGSERGRVKATGRVFDNPWALAFTVRNGKVSEFRSYEDTAAVAAAFRAD